MEKNEYFISTNGGLNAVQLKYTKQNYSNFVEMMLYLISAKFDTNASKFKDSKKFNNYIHSTSDAFIADSRTGRNSNQLIKKLEFLVNQISTNKDARDKVSGSFFINEIIKKLGRGYYSDSDSDEGWINYKKISNEFPQIKSSFLIANLCFIDDNTMPIGLDVAKLIDAIVVVGADGKFQIQDITDQNEQAKMIDAMQKQLKLLRSNYRFQKIFAYCPKTTNEKDETERD